MLIVIPISPGFGAPCRARLFLVDCDHMGVFSPVLETKGAHAPKLYQIPCNKYCTRNSRARQGAPKAGLMGITVNMIGSNS